MTLIGVFVVMGNAERWCPFGGVEAIYTYVTEGTMICSLGVSNFFALFGVILSLFLLRRAFCGYACPIGAITEWVGKAGGMVGLKPHRVPRAVDAVLGLLKYGVLALILWITWRAGELHFRAADPCYALLSRHGEDITFWAYLVAGGILVGGLFTTVPFCRWLCPLAAVMNPFSRFGLFRIRKDEQACNDCGFCEQVCPMNIAVMKAGDVTAARCTGCQTCVASCPSRKKGALTFSVPGPARRHWPKTAVASVLVLVTAVVVASAQLFPLPAFVKEKGDPPAVTASIDLRIEGVTCRGSATLLTYFLFRDDILMLPGYVKLEAWPGPGFAPVRVTYDPAQTEPEFIKEAIVTPYYDAYQDIERSPPFVIEGYSPWKSGG
ncbi:MAG: 4Fe-4S binding protein [Planctomycetota bacterium]